MAAKERYCYQILKSHSVVVDFDGQPHLTKVPSIVEGETFKQWKRVLGPDVENVVIYGPYEPKPQTRMHNVSGCELASNVERMFQSVCEN
jgi:hypothetical protein